MPMVAKMSKAKVANMSHHPMRMWHCRQSRHCLGRPAHRHRQTTHAAVVIAAHGHEATQQSRLRGHEVTPGVQAVTQNQCHTLPAEDAAMKSSPVMMMMMVFGIGPMSHGEIIQETKETPGSVRKIFKGGSTPILEHDGTGEARGQRRRGLTGARRAVKPTSKTWCPPLPLRLRARLRLGV